MISRVLLHFVSIFSWSGLYSALGQYGAVLGGTGSVLHGTKVFFKNLDQALAIGLVWQDSLK